MIIVSNSTPLIALSRKLFTKVLSKTALRAGFIFIFSYTLKKFNLLKEYFGEISIPKEVFDEVVVRGRNLSGAEEVASVNWIKVEDVMNKIAVESLSMTLDRGEAEAIVLAKEKDALLIIDDGEGRRAAEFFGLKITGTIGILLLASEDGKLDLKTAIDDLMAAGFRLSEKEYKRILNLN